MHKPSKNKKSQATTSKGRPKQQSVNSKSEEEVALQRISASVNTSLNQLNLNYVHARRQAEQWSRISLVIGSLGFIVLLVGIVVLFTGQVEPGIITAGVGVVTEGATLLLFRQSKEASKRVEENQRNLEKVQKIHDAITLWERMKPGQSRDKLLDTIIQQAFAREGGFNLADEPSDNSKASAASKREIEGTVTITNSRLDRTSGDIAGVKISGDEGGNQ